MEQDNSTEMKALDIIEAGAALTEQQLNELRQSDELQEDVQDLLDIKTAMRMSDVDVEERLRQFHELHSLSLSSDLPESNTPRFSSHTSLYIKVLALAAAFIGLLWVFTFWKTQDHHLSDAQEQLAQGIVFTADKEQDGICLMNEQGEKVTLSAATQQNSTITLDDFRKIFADKERTESVTLNVPYGKSAAVSLPDGSTAYLHPGSKIAFPTVFVGKDRVVMLEGRAYFKVTKDTDHPFIVMTDKAQTTVLGTEFDINTVSGEITLIHGSIKVNAKDTGKEIILKPHQQVLIGNLTEVSTVDVVPYEYWRDGYLYFDNVELKDIMEAIGKNFNMTVEFRNQEALHYKMRFIAERNNGVEAAIDMMNRMKKVNVSIKNDKIVVD